MNFTFRCVNRLKYPTKNIIVCEDDLDNQKKFAEYFAKTFEPQGEVQISFVSGALQAAAIMHYCTVDLIVLDHDMPLGSGSDLLNWMKQYNVKIPVITASGIDYNNTTMMNLGANYMFSKQDIFDGKAYDLMKEILFPAKKTGIASTYLNTYCKPPVMLPRYWVTPNIMVGGNIVDEKDLQNLIVNHDISAIINVDEIKDPDFDNILHLHVNDDGTHFPKENIEKIIEFAKANKDRCMYVHCHLGFSRSPHFVYAILRGLGDNKDVAMAKVKQALPSANHLFGFSQHTDKYVESIENALK